MAPRTILNNALLRAVIAQSEDQVEKLLLKGADPDTTDPSGWNLLHRVASHGPPVIAELLLEHGATIDSVQPSGDTALHVAVAGRNVKMAALLVEMGADPNARGSHGKTPLDLAFEDITKRGSFKMFVCIARKSGAANVNMTDKYGNTALSLACQKGHGTAIGLLLEAGASLYRRNYVGRTPLDFLLGMPIYRDEVKNLKDERLCEYDTLFDLIICKGKMMLHVTDKTLKEKILSKEFRNKYPVFVRVIRHLYIQARRILKDQKLAWKNVDKDLTTLDINNNCFDRR